MRGTVFLGGLGALAALVMATSPRSAHPRQPPPRHVPPETPWLTPEASAQIVGAHGQMGPLFDHAMLGGPAPPPAERSRIAEFARANHVRIDLEIVDDALAAVRFEVTYGGCCGYEGADSLGRRLERPKIGGDCSGEGPAWLDDWAITSDDGTYVRASVHVNRVVVRWEHEVTSDELVERADDLVGANRVAVAARARDRWTELDPNRSYRLDVPYAFDRASSYHALRGIDVEAARGRIVATSFEVRDDDESNVAKFRARLRAHWGQPSVRSDRWTWTLRDRVVTAAIDESTTKVTIASR